MLSYMEGALPADVEPAFRRVLGRLQASAPALSWDAVEAVLREELGTWPTHF